MKAHSLWLAASASLLCSQPQAADAVASRQVLLDRPIARLADQELGYSVLHDSGPSLRGYRVHVTCTLTGRFAQTYCPTTRYVASCPRAEIICQ
jgi:hypothetical protein